MSNEALKQDDIPEDQPIEDQNTDEQEVEEFEVVVDGEEEPTAPTVPLTTYLKDKAKWKGKAKEPNQEAEELRRKLKLKEEEAEHLMKALGNPTPDPNQFPDIADFEDDAAYQAAVAEYIKSQSSTQAKQIVREEISRLGQTATQQTQEQEFDRATKSHYEKVPTLKVSDYEETEDKAIDNLGLELAKTIIAKFPDKSPLILYHLGKNEGTAQELASLAASDPFALVQKLTRLGDRLKSQPKRSQPPDPDTPLKGGAPSNSEDWARRLDKLRDEVASGKKSVRDVLELKKQAREAGVTL